MTFFFYILFIFFFGAFCYQIGKKNNFTPSAISTTNNISSNDNSHYTLLPDYDHDLNLERSRYKKNQLLNESKNSQYSSFKEFPPPPTQIINSNQNSIFTITSSQSDENDDNNSLDKSSSEASSDEIV